MKLQSIKMINSGNFSYADLFLDADSIQIAGKNNRGKTSLLWTLLFLFVADRKQSVHPDYGVKESLGFYFSPDKSYIIFEGFDEKQGYFYMLLRREGDAVKYHFVKKKFEDRFLIRDGEVLEFKEVLRNPETGIGTPLSSIPEVLATVITSKRGEVGFLRLKKDKNSRRFAELYKHLFKPSKNDSNLLKDGILIALGLQSEELDFGKGIGQEDKKKWQKEEREIKVLKNIQHKLNGILEKKEILQSAKVLLELEVVKYDMIDFKALLDLTKKKESELLETQKECKLQLGKIEGTISLLGEKRDLAIRTHTERSVIYKEAEEELKFALALKEEEIWIKQEHANNESKFSKLSMILKEISSPAISKKEIETRLLRSKNKLKSIQAYIEKGEDTLLMNISTDQEATIIANTVLSDTIKTLPKEMILHGSIDNNPQQINFNGVYIDISNIPTKSLPTIEEKKAEMREEKENFERLSAQMQHIDKREETEKECREVGKKLHSLSENMEKIQNIEIFIKKKEILSKEVDEHKQALHKIETSIESKKVQYTSEEERIKDIDTQISLSKNQRDKLFNFNSESLEGALKKTEKVYKKGNFELSIEEVYDRVLKGEKGLCAVIREYEDKELRLEEEMDSVKRDLRGMEIPCDTDKEFIDFLEKKCYGLEAREKELVKIIETSYHIFFQSIKKFLQNLDEIRAYASQISRLISKYKISNLSGIGIKPIWNTVQIDILKAMNSDEIHLFSNFERSEDDLYSTDDFMAEYIQKEKVILLSDLFDIDLEIKKNDKKETSQQSNGTKRMLHVMLLLILVREMINPDDTIPFLIDEVSDIDSANQAELLSFFKELNLLPISASPKVSHDFEKIFHIEEVEGRSYLSDKTASWKEKENEDVA